MNVYIAVKVEGADNQTQIELAQAIQNHTNDIKLKGGKITCSTVLIPDVDDNDIEIVLAHVLSVWADIATNDKEVAVKRTKTALFLATGIPFKSYVAKNRQITMYFLRMIFAKLCAEIIDAGEIALLLKRDRRLINIMLDNFADEYAFNKYFKSLADKSTMILNNLATHTKPTQDEFNK